MPKSKTAPGAAMRKAGMSTEDTVAYTHAIKLLQEHGSPR